MEEGDYKDGEVDSKRLAFIRAMLDRTERQGLVILEHSTCPHCKETNIHGHNFSEVLVCVHENCKKKYASRIPRPVVQGDILAAHYELAVAYIHNIERQNTLDGLKPIALDEYEGLPEEIKLLLNRHKTAVTRSTCERIANLADQYAQGKTNG